MSSGNGPSVEYADLKKIDLDKKPLVVTDVKFDGLATVDEISEAADAAARTAMESLSKVASSGDYNDLVNKPEIPEDVGEIMDRLDSLPPTEDIRRAVEGMEGKADKDDVYTKEEVDGLIGDLSYTEISISSFSANPSSAEVGSTVPSVTLSYSLNKNAESATLDGSPRTLPGRSGHVPDPTGLPLTSSKTWTLRVTDAGSSSHDPHTATRTCSCSFQWKRYWGASAEPASIDDDFILGLSGKELASGRSKTFSANAGTGQYIWYAIPKSWGACSFKVGGFDGGFQLVATFNHENSSGGKTDYFVYRSDNHSLGSTSVTVS